MVAHPLLLALLVGSTARIDVYLQESEEMEPEQAIALADALVSAIEDAANARPTLQIEAPCELGDAACLLELQRRSGADAVVLIRIFGGLSRIGLSAERYSQGQPSSLAEAVLPNAREGWTEPLEQLASTLFPRPLFSTDASLVVAEPVRVEERSSAPWVLFGAGTIFVATGAVFALSSQSAREDLAERRYSGADEYRSLDHQMVSHGVVANTLIGVSAVAVVAGVAWLVFD